MPLDIDRAEYLWDVHHELRARTDEPVTERTAWTVLSGTDIQMAQGLAAAISTDE